MEKLPPPTFKFEGKTFKQGDVIVNRKEKIYAVLSEIQVDTHEPPTALSFLGPIEIHAPKFYVAYLEENRPGTKLSFRVLEPETGIGTMDDFDLATEDEIRYFEKQLLAEGHTRYKHPEISFEYIPFIGDTVIAWNGDDTSKAVVGVVSEIHVDGNGIRLNDGNSYEHCSLFCDEMNFLTIIKSK